MTDSHPTTAPDPAAAPLASLLYAPNDAKVDLLARFAAARSAEGVAVDGVLIETTWLDARTKGGLVARRIAAPGERRRRRR